MIPKIGNTGNVSIQPTRDFSMSPLPYSAQKVMCNANVPKRNPTKNNDKTTFIQITSEIVKIKLFLDFLSNNSLAE